MTMWILSVVFFSFLATVSYGQPSCPANAQNRIMGCVAHMSGFTQATSVAEQRAHCGEARSAIACVEAIVQECHGIEGTPLEQMVSSFAMVNEQLDALCGPPATENVVPTNPPVTSPPATSTVASTCSRRDRRKLQRCSRKMQRYATESPVRCGKVRKVLDCMATYMAKCSSVVGEDTINRLSSLRGDLIQICVETNEVEDNEIDENTGASVTDENVDSTCPPGHTGMIQDCVQALQRGRYVSGIEEKCRIMETGLNCVEDIMNRCPNQEDVRAMVRMMNMDQIRALMRSRCSGGPMPTMLPGSNSNCPAGSTQRLMSCVDPLSQLRETGMVNGVEGCRTAQTGIQCIDEVFENCAGDEAVQTISSMINIDEMRNIIDEACSNTGGCSIANPAHELERCNGFLAAFQRDQSNMGQACRSLYEGFDCFRHLINECPEDPAVGAFTSMIDIEAARSSMSAYCPRRR